MKFLALLPLATVLSASPLSAPPNVTMAEFTKSDDVLDKRSTGIAAWLYSDNCSGASSYTWSNPGTGCYTYNGNTDMYALYTYSGLKGLLGCSHNFILNVYHGNNACSGYPTGVGNVDVGCHSLNGQSMKSFYLYCV
ncbi:hypothetical protein V8C37DRAFT_378000 [Trichoderma ceciliae]